MDGHTDDTVTGEERSSAERKGRTIPIEHHHFRFERQRNMLSDEDQTFVEKDRHRVRERERRQNMTDEQRLVERERRRLRDEQRRKRMTDEQRSIERERRRNREKERRNNMNDEQRALEMERRRIRERQHRQNMDDEQRSKDRERRRQRDRQRRESMNDEQRSQERERRRLYEQQKRGNQTASQFLMCQIDQISGGCEDEQDNRNASYSTDVTDGSQSLGLGHDNLDVVMTNTTELSSTTTLYLNEGELFENIENPISDDHATDATDHGNQILVPKHDNMIVKVPNADDSSSTNTVGQNEVTLVANSGERVVANCNLSYPTDVISENPIHALDQDNLKGEASMSEPSSITSLDINENTVPVYNGDENIDVHVKSEGFASDDHMERGLDSGKVTSLEGNECKDRISHES